MLGRSKKILSLFGFEVKIDLSWLVLAVLIVWSLALGFFPHYFPGLSKLSYWLMGIFGALGLFFSIIFHELSHSLVARKYGLPIKSITLFIFGGVAQMDEQPKNPKTEFLMAVAGPISSILLGFLFYGIGTALSAMAVSQFYTGIFSYLAFINWLVAGFNLIPAFPLDGGRVLRSVLWHWKKNIKWATRIASGIGRGFGIFLIIFGILQFFSGNIIGGVWLFLIGMFVQNASKLSYSQLIMRQGFEGEHVKKFMTPDPVTIGPDVKLDDFVENYLYKYHFKMFPVVKNDKLVGCITTKLVKGIPRDEWKSTAVGEIAAKCGSNNTIGPEDDVMKAIRMMNRSDNRRLMVVDNGKLVGILTFKEILKVLSIKMDLEKD